MARLAPRRRTAAARIVPLLAAPLLVLVLTGCPDEDPAGPEPEAPLPAALGLEQIAQGLSNPLFLTSPRNDPRLFVVEQVGLIRIVENGQLLEPAFLDISDLVSRGGEQGLLSMVFHPSYATNGFFYVNYTDEAGDTRVVRYRVSGDPRRADANSATPVLDVDQPFENHNGGLLLFGADGMLYVGLGDGGGGGDPQDNGQDRGTLLGKLLRIDVNGDPPYEVPPSNPFVGMAGARGEIWAWGLRNPWRFSFDRSTGELYVADVGQGQFEEVNVVAGNLGGVNYGWDIMEGAHCFGSDTCTRTGLTLPVLEYSHSDGCSVTGGYVYRGSAIPGLVGHYLYSDFCAGWLRSFKHVDGGATELHDWPVGDIGNILSFGEDAVGELYMLSANGRVYRIVPAP